MSSSDESELRAIQGQAARMALVERLARGVAHELGNPLAAMTAFGHLLQSEPRLPDDMRRDADLLVAETERARRVSAAFLDFVRARPTGTPSALRPSLDRALELIAFELTAAGIRTAVDVPDSLPAIALDGATLDQILVSMVLDAIDVARASGGGGTIAITAGTNDDGAVRIATAERVLTLPTAAAKVAWERGEE